MHLCFNYTCLCFNLLSVFWIILQLYVHGTGEEISTQELVISGSSVAQ
jgi:hypothetical protein